MYVQSHIHYHTRSKLPRSHTSSSSPRSPLSLQSVFSFSLFRLDRFISLLRVHIKDHHAPKLASQTLDLVLFLLDFRSPEIGRSILLGFALTRAAMVGGTQPLQQQQQQQLQPQTTTTAPTSAEEEALKRNTDCVYFLASPLTCKKVRFSLSFSLCVCMYIFIYLCFARVYAWCMFLAVLVNDAFCGLWILGFWSFSLLSEIFVFI